MRKRRSGEVHLLGWWLGLPRRPVTGARQVSFFPTAAQLEVWGAGPVLLQVTPGPRFLGACCFQKVFSSHVTKADLSPPQLCHQLLAKGTAQEGGVRKQWPFTGGV